MFTVKVQMVPGGTETFNSDQAITVERAMQLAKVTNIKNFTPSIGGENVALDKVIDSDSTITLIKKQIKGN